MNPRYYGIGFLIIVAAIIILLLAGVIHFNVAAGK